MTDQDIRAMLAAAEAEKAAALKAVQDGHQSLERLRALVDGTKAPTTPPLQVITPAEAAAQAKLSKATIHALINQGIIPSIHFGRSVRIPLPEWQEFLATGGKQFSGGWRKEEKSAPIVRESGRAKR